MPYQVIITESAQKSLRKLDKKIRDNIFNKLESLKENPHIGKLLSANLSGFWSLRVRDYRVIYQIKNNELIILVIGIGHRKNVYD